MRVLLVTHEASRTGAPRVAVLVARSLVDQGDTVRILSRRPGPLLEDFEAVAPTRVERFFRVRRKLWTLTHTRRVALIVDTALAALALVRLRPDVVYINSTAAAIYVRPARWLGCHVVVHVHESGLLSEQFLRTAGALNSLTGVSVVACSPTVHTDLVALTGRATSEVHLLPSVPDGSEVIQLSQASPDRPYAPDDVVVGCCGTVEHRKGADLWVKVASLVQHAMPERQVRFVWVGEIVEPVVRAIGNADIEFTGPSANPYAHLHRFDVATLPSRDDPFPLVVLEAMLVGTPVVAFAVGGVPQQIGDAGILVPPEDVEAFADAVVQLLRNGDERRRLGSSAQARVQRLYSIDAFAKGLAHVMTGVAGERRDDPRARPDPDPQGRRETLRRSGTA